MTSSPEAVVHFYNRRGTCEQWIKEGKLALTWTRLSCSRFASNRVRLALFVLAYNLGNFLRRFALPKDVSHWSLSSIQLKLIKIGAKIVSHSRMTVFQMAEVAVPEKLFRSMPVSYTHLRAHETRHDLVCRLLLEKKKKKQ